MMVSARKFLTTGEIFSKKLGRRIKEKFTAFFLQPEAYREETAPVPSPENLQICQATKVGDPAARVS